MIDIELDDMRVSNVWLMNVCYGICLWCLIGWCGFVILFSIISPWCVNNTHEKLNVWGWPKWVSVQRGIHEKGGLNNTYIINKYKYTYVR